MWRVADKWRAETFRLSACPAQREQQLGRGTIFPPNAFAPDFYVSIEVGLSGAARCEPQPR